MRRLLFLVAFVAVAPPLTAQATRVIAPKDNFLLEITQMWGDSSSLGSLVKRVMRAGDIELRVWGGYGLGGTDGVIMRRERGRWRAWEARESQDTLDLRPLPEEGLDTVWANAVKSGVRALPMKIPRKWIMTDGFTYVVELREGNAYRASVIESVETPEADGDRKVKAVYEAVVQAIPPARRRPAG